jgi:hypothetical protein
LGGQVWGLAVAVVVIVIVVVVVVVVVVPCPPRTAPARRAIELV